jgi:hypothetical protein
MSDEDKFINAARIAYRMCKSGQRSIYFDVASTTSEMTKLELSLNNRKDERMLLDNYVRAALNCVGNINHSYSMIEVYFTSDELVEYWDNDLHIPIYFSRAECFILFKDVEVAKKVIDYIDRNTNVRHHTAMVDISNGYFSRISKYIKTGKKIQPTHKKGKRYQQDLRYLNDCLHVSLDTKYNTLCWLHMIDALHGNTIVNFNVMCSCNKEIWDTIEKHFKNG